MPTVTAVDMSGGRSAVQATTAPDRQSSPNERTQAAPAATEAPAVDPQVAVARQAQAEMARREQRIRQDSRRLQAERQRYQVIEAENVQHRAREARFTSDPMNAYGEYGITGDQLTHSILNQPSNEELRHRKVEAELKAVKDQMEASQTASYDQAKRQIRKEASQLVFADKAFETTKAMGATEAIVELIEQTFLAPEEDGGGYLMPVEEAAREVEEYLIGEALKVASLGKIRARLSPAQSQHATAQSQQASRQTTLSNRQPPSSAKISTDRDRRERAMLAFQGKLS